MKASEIMYKGRTCKGGAIYNCPCPYDYYGNTFCHKSLNFTVSLWLLLTLTTHQCSAVESGFFNNKSSFLRGYTTLNVGLNKLKHNHKDKIITIIKPALLHVIIIPLSRLANGGGLSLIQVSGRSPGKGEQRLIQM